jgi:hypothetical protein
MSELINTNILDDLQDFSSSYLLELHTMRSGGEGSARTDNSLRKKEEHRCGTHFFPSCVPWLWWRNEVQFTSNTSIDSGLLPPLHHSSRKQKMKINQNLH